MRNDGSPNFTTSVLDTLRHSTKRQGFAGIIPFSLILFHTLPLLATWYWQLALVPPDRSNLIEVLGACTAVAGILTAFSVAAAGQIYSIASPHPFSDFLRQENLFDQFLVSPQITFLTQMIVVVEGLICCFLALYINADWVKFAVAFFFGSLAYEFYATWGLVDLMRKITWHKADYDRLSATRADDRHPR